MEEKWVNMNGYKISNYGVIIGKKGKPLSVKPDKKGYLTCNIDLGEPFGRVSGQHRVIAFAFLYEDYKKGCEVNHIDGNKSNNMANNLEWVTHQENMEHVSDNRLHPKACWCCVIDEKSKVINTYNSISAMARDFGLSKNNIALCCDGGSDSAFGIRFRKYDKNKETFIKTRFDNESLHKKGRYKRVIRCIETNDVANSQQEMSKKLGVHQSDISKVLTKKIDNINGYRFIYDDK